MDTPTKDLAAAQVRGNDIGPVDAHALSALPTLESQGQSARSSRATGSLPVVEAEALSQEWLGRSLKCAAASRRDSAQGRETHAWCNEVRSATYLLCADELRQRAGLPTSRQPEENVPDEPTRASAGSTQSK